MIRSFESHFPGHWMRNILKCCLYIYAYIYQSDILSGSTDLHCIFQECICSSGIPSRFSIDKDVVRVNVYIFETVDRMKVYR